MFVQCLHSRFNMSYRRGRMWTVKRWKIINNCRHPYTLNRIFHFYFHFCILFKRCDDSLDDVDDHDDDASTWVNVYIFRLLFIVMMFGLWDVKTVHISMALLLWFIFLMKSWITSSTLKSIRFIYWTAGGQTLNDNFCQKSLSWRKQIIETRSKRNFSYADS